MNFLDPFSLRVDVISRLLYWTDNDLGTVSVSDLEGNYRMTIIENGLDKPASIVTEPQKGFVCISHCLRLNRIFDVLHKS